MNVLCNGHAVFEIKGAPCTRCAYFSCRVHIFETCAPGVCMILSNYKEVFIVSNTLTHGWVHHFWFLCTRQVHKIEP